MRMAVSILSLIVMINGAVVSADIPQNMPPAELTDVLRTEHPRLFFNAETFPAVKGRALGENRGQEGMRPFRLSTLHERIHLYA